MGTIICIACFEEHPVEFFNKDKTRDTGHDPRCKNCTRAACKRVYNRYHEKHVALKRRWKAENPERRREINKLWRQTNPDKVRAGTANYRKRWRRATPPWVNLADIKAFYAACPKGYHVDHIHPLAGENFSGLNVPWNLQYLPADVHWKKGRRLEAAGGVLFATH